MFPVRRLVRGLGCLLSLLWGSLHYWLLVRSFKVTCVGVIGRAVLEESLACKQSSDLQMV